MTFSTSHPASVLLGSLDRRQPQQIAWTYEYREDRTAVTYPSKDIDATQEPAMPHIYETSIFDSRSNVSANTSSQDIPSFSKVLQALINTTSISISNLHTLISLFQSWRDVRSNWGIVPSSSDVFQDLAKITSIWNEKSPSATFISEAQLQLLEGYYVFRNDAEIKHFLREYPFLTQLLLDTFSRIEEYFPDSQVFLEVATDYEAVDHISKMMNSDKELIASISTHLPPEEAIETLDKFYDNWWLKALEEAKGKISFGLEFL